METVLRIISVALAWYLIGFLSICITNFFDKVDSYEQWRKHRGIFYGLAFAGPICTIIIVADALIQFIKTIWKLYRASRFFPIGVKIADWMIAGFRKPPAPPVAENDEAPDFPTASP